MEYYSDSDTESVCSTLSEASSVEGSRSTKVYVGRKLPLNISEHDIKQHFQKHGFSESDISVSIARKGGMSMGWGIVTLGSQENAEEAIDRVNGTLLHGTHELVVSTHTRQARRRRKSSGPPSPSGSRVGSSPRKKSQSSPISKSRSRQSSTASSQGDVTQSQEASARKDASDCKIIVGPNLAKHIVAQHIREHFAEFVPNLCNIEFQESNTKPVERFAILTFSSQSVAEKVIKAKNGTKLLGTHALQVEMSIKGHLVSAVKTSRVRVTRTQASDVGACPPALLIPSPKTPTLRVGGTVELQNLHALVTEKELLAMIGDIQVVRCSFETTEESSVSESKSATLVFSDPADAPKVVAAMDGKVFLGCAVSARVLPVLVASPRSVECCNVVKIGSNSFTIAKDSATVLIRNVPENIKRGGIRRAFRIHGMIASIEISACSTPTYALVAFSSVVEAQAACIAKNNRKLGQNQISVCQVRIVQAQGQGNSQSGVAKGNVSTGGQAGLRSLNQSAAHLVDSPATSGHLGDKLQTMAGAKAAVLYFTCKDYSVGRRAFQSYLDHHLPKSVGKFDIVKMKRSESSTEIQVQFASTNAAKRALKVLDKIPSDYIISLDGCNSKPVIAEIADFQASIQRKRNQYLTQHHLKLKRFEHQLKEAQLPKKCPLHLFDSLQQKKKAAEQQVTECREQQAEFVFYCDSLEQKLKQLELSASATRKPLQGKISNMRKEFGRECSLFVKALPIYAKRRAIIEAVQKNQVMVLIGETGSGKSTQIVQYLHNAGLSENGIIVCTQPRKVAAVSLAKHVATEMDVKLGTTLGYKMGVTGKHTQQTKVLYMTDHTLLNECIADRNFSKYSCLIIDEAHERSLHTDLLLAFIKQVLPKRPDLRVVITSATIDPKLFTAYFGDQCPVLQVPGRTFPVEVIWNAHKSTGTEATPAGAVGGNSDPPKANEYVASAVQVAVSIHRREDSGDVLVFLTSPAEIERACQSIAGEVSAADTVILPLHGKLQPEDQQKVFHEYDGKRKIIFSTNVAETSVTIPGIKYIVDTGLAKELCFDPKRSMNSLEVRNISQSSAEQRKGRAGRTSAGKCYRLYSEEEYETMPARMLPEILRVHLAHACLKLYEFGISDVIAFDFVEHPDPVALKAAVETLSFLGAVSEEKLTEVGRHMAALPLDPQLSKVLLDGISAEVGPEAAAAVAISSLAGNVFFRGGTDEMKSKSDRTKIQFCHPAGDQMTHLSVYNTWVQQRRDQRTQWCVENCINAKSMRLVEETLRELREILSENLEIVLPARALCMEKAEEELPKLFFYSFIRNLSVFLGHERIGYVNTSMPDTPFVVFPGSSLNQLNSVPQAVIFEKTLKTSQNFLLQVLPVQEEWIQEAAATGRLSTSLLAQLQERAVTPVTVANIGQYVFGKTINRETIPRITNQLKNICHDTPCCIDLDHRDHGIVRVFCQNRYHASAKRVVEERLNCVRSSLQRVQYEEGVTKKEDNVRLLLGLGGCIQHVLMPYQYRSLVVKGPEEADWVDEALASLFQYGEIERHNFQVFTKQKQCLLFVTYYDPDHAQLAVTLEEPQEGITIEPKLPSATQAGSLFHLQFEWCRRQRKPYGFVNFKCQEDFQIARSQLLGSKVFVHGSYVSFCPSKNDGLQLFIPNAGLEVTAQELKAAVELHVHGVEVDIILICEAPFKTTLEQRDAIQRGLESQIDRYATKGRYQVSFSVPQDYYKTFRVYVTFQNPDEGQKTLIGLKYSQIGGKPLTVKAKLCSSNWYKPQVYKAIEASVTALKPYLHLHFGDSVRLVEKTDKGGNTIIEISSEDIKAFTAAKSLLNATASPDVIECHTAVLRQFMLSHNCQKDLAEIQSDTSTYIYADRRTMSLNIYGTQANQSLAKILLNRKLDVLAGGNTTLQEYHLKARGQPAGLMKHLVSRFGLDLLGMVEEGVSAVQLDGRRQILTVYATADAHGRINDIIEEYIASAPARGGAKVDPDIIECCVCFMSIDNPKEVFRLEYCGHEYCLDCIQLQVSPNAITFPVQCATDGCSHPFIWQDFCNLFQRVPFKLADLKVLSLRAYLKENKKKVRNCPTPDCEMVYAVTDDGKQFYCCLCGVSICTKCHEQYHDGLSCKTYQAGKQGEKEFEEWLRKDQHSRKRCPSCNTPIEKIEGCNKMHCTQCRVHICWVCLAYFSSGQQCYAHLATKHGSFV